MEPASDVHALLVQLAQDSGDSSIGDLLLWLGILLIVVIVGTLVLLALRRRLSGDESAGSQGFLLSDLRAMRDRGDLSDEEFEQAKAAMIGHLKTSVTSETKGSDETSPRASTDNAESDETNAT